ncbi:uncharacterized protein N7515_001083 [Penicillium bovifimosum]|uniref:non-specific serine/threonine protein kinase n=1 Tax=Penicillium bovifimosum TaxID=126998 RepID=A0A9W9HG61_9EURO|nr:uncharacterized protein N7515_001083 [Penicillium bovifimosum]KAJ5146519.1 hypothetical protein N7515_001083 [Penicillium bovifimosum]
MSWRANPTRIHSNVKPVLRWKVYPLPIRAYRRVSLFDRQMAWSRRCSSQWTSNPTVFPTFDLRLLDPSLKYEELATRGDVSKEICTYSVEEGDVLNDRYHILHQIGCGPTSTVWFAVDMLDPRMVVLKIYVVDYMLNTYGRIHPPKLYNQLECPLYEVSDRFTMKGPQGSHICVVHEAPSMDPEQVHAGDHHDLGLIRSTMKQMLIMLDFLHTDCYLTARISPNDPPDGQSANSVAGIDPNKHLDANTDRARVAGPSNGQPITPIILPGDGVPLTFHFPDEDKSDIAENHSRSPEEILKSKVTYKTDIWAIGMTAWRSTNFQEMINGRNSNGAFDDRVHVAELVALLGPPPAAFRENVRLGSMFWDGEGNWTGQAPIPNRSLESLTSSDGASEEAEGFLKWIKNALQWDPDDRPTALGLLRHDWMSQTTKPVKGEDTEVSIEGG